MKIIKNLEDAMRKGFTLIELIVVIAIIAVLAAIIAPNAFKAIEKAKIAATEEKIRTIKTACNALYADTGHWPGDDAPFFVITYMPFDTVSEIYIPSIPTHPNDLMENDSDWTGWDGPYVEKLRGKGQWGSTDVLVKIDSGIEEWNGLWLGFYSNCHGNAASLSCAMPDNAQAKIDNDLDDGNSSSGKFRDENAANAPTLGSESFELYLIKAADN